MKPVKDLCIILITITGVGLIRGPQAALAAPPTAEVAKRCLHYAYIAYPFKRPGAVRMTGDREAYFRDCLAKNGDVPIPARPGQAAPTTEAAPVRNDASPTKGKE